MYYTVSELADKVTDYQVELLLLLDKGFDIVTNEGSGFRCWLEMEIETVDYAVRKDSANSLLELLLMKPVDEDRRGHFRYHIADKGKLVLERIDVRKPNRMRAIENKLLKKGFEGVKYSHLKQT